ncbi:MULTISPECIES: nitrogen regulation protein NR(II) [Brevundimonas]|uniref:two-component system sensor histidine kinase NtrB n=1 Tax=Brevundimonas TaxID=41275 RepID=UPI000627E680|nr:MULTISPECIES: PAS domain-containing sensor histidine kinase [Brevundimonas]OMG59329.1 PAS domain-containing sensor histidine kinase [Brevundimonas sp. ZS04]
MACALFAVAALTMGLAAPSFPRDLALIALTAALAASTASILVWRQASRLAKALAARDAMLQVAFLSTPTLMLTREGVISRLNDTALAMFRITKEQALGRPFADMVPGFTMAAVIASGMPSGLLKADADYWVGRRADGSTFPVGVQFGLAPGGPDQDFVALGLADLTLHYAAETQARELHAQLNTVWRLNSLGEMAATLAHELNQPLSAASGYMHASRADMEKAGSLGDSACRTLDLAQAQLLRAGQIIRRIRAFLSQETGGMGDESVAAMIETMKQILTRMGQDKDVAVRIDLDADGDRVRADRIQFQQAVVNLVRNAVEAAAGGVGAQVRILGLAEADGYRISIEDNGPGVADDQRDRLFQPMTSTKPGGMGLGLSVTRTIVERHGGVLNVGRSQALGGAAFFFTLPKEQEARTA